MDSPHFSLPDFLWSWLNFQNEQSVLRPCHLFATEKDVLSFGLFVTESGPQWHKHVLIWRLLLPQILCCYYRHGHFCPIRSGDKFTFPITRAAEIEGELEHFPWQFICIFRWFERKPDCKKQACCPKSAEIIICVNVGEEQCG